MTQSQSFVIVNSSKFNEIKSILDSFEEEMKANPAAQPFYFGKGGKAYPLSEEVVSTLGLSADINNWHYGSSHLLNVVRRELEHCTSTYDNYSFTDYNKVRPVEDKDEVIIPAEMAEVLRLDYKPEVTLVSDEAFLVDGILYPRFGRSVSLASLMEAVGDEYAGVFRYSKNTNLDNTSPFVVWKGVGLHKTGDRWWNQAWLVLIKSIPLENLDCRQSEKKERYLPYSEVMLLHDMYGVDMPKLPEIPKILTLNEDKDIQFAEIVRKEINRAVILTNLGEASDFTPLFERGGKYELSTFTKLHVVRRLVETDTLILPRSFRGHLVKEIKPARIVFLPSQDYSGCDSLIERMYSADKDLPTFELVLDPESDLTYFNTGLCGSYHKSPQVSKLLCGDVDILPLKIEGSPSSKDISSHNFSVAVGYSIHGYDFVKYELAKTTLLQNSVKNPQSALEYAERLYWLFSEEEMAQFKAAEEADAKAKEEAKAADEAKHSVQNLIKALYKAFNNEDLIDGPVTITVGDKKLVF